MTTETDCPSHIEAREKISALIDGEADECVVNELDDVTYADLRTLLVTPTQEGVGLSDDDLDALGGKIEALTDQRVFGLYDYSAYPEGDLLSHVVRREPREVVFQSNNPNEARAHYERLRRIEIAKRALSLLPAPKLGEGAEALSSEEVAVLREELQARIDYHDNNESLAESCDCPESAKYHRDRRLLLQSMHDRASPQQPAPGAPEGWREINTAPKDGTRLWLYQPDRDEEAQQYIGWWKEDFGHWEGWTDNWDSEPEPTHWRPLPARPDAALTSSSAKPVEDAQRWYDAYCIAHEQATANGAANRRLREGLEKAREVIAFFSAVIKSGESWCEVCEMAKADFDRLTAAATTTCPRPTPSKDKADG